jgi:hypothetical protein
MSGSVVRSIATFRDINGVLTNPTATTFKYRAGAGSTQVINAPVNDSPGIFHYDMDTSGFQGPDLLLYTLEWIGTGVVQAIDNDYFNVEAPAL